MPSCCCAHALLCCGKAVHVELMSLHVILSHYILCMCYAHTEHAGPMLQEIPGQAVLILFVCTFCFVFFPNSDVPFFHNLEIAFDQKFVCCCLSQYFCWV